MIAEVCRTLQEELTTLMRRKIGVTPHVSELESLSEPGTIPTAIRFSVDWTDYATGTQHTLIVTTTHTVFNDRRA